MKKLSDEELDQLVRDSFPAVEVSPDFTLRLWLRLKEASPGASALWLRLKEASPGASALWRRVIRQPATLLWGISAPAAGVAAAAGVLAGFLFWGQVVSAKADPRDGILRQGVRLDLFGNAPYDTLSGSYLKQDDFSVRKDG